MASNIPIQEKGVDDKGLSTAPYQHKKQATMGDIFNKVQMEVIQKYVLPQLICIIAKKEFDRRVKYNKKWYRYYEVDEVVKDDGTPGKWVGVEIIVSKYDQTVPERKLGGPGSKTEGPYYHCAEYVWNSIFLAGWQVPYYKEGTYAGYYISPNRLYLICETLSELSSPNPNASFKNNTVYKGTQTKKKYGLPGPQLGDVLVARHNEAMEGQSGHYSLLYNKRPLEFIEAGSSLEIEDEYELHADTIGDHKSRIVRPILPDWCRIYDWLEDKEGSVFHRYYQKDGDLFSELMFEAVDRAEESGVAESKESIVLQQIKQILQVRMLPQWIREMINLK